MMIGDESVGHFLNGLRYYRRRTGIASRTRCCWLLAAVCMSSLAVAAFPAFAAAPLPQMHEAFEVFDPDPGLYDAFGWSVAIDGNVAIVGMAGSVNGQGPSSAAYVYRVDTGDLLHTLTPPIQNLDDGFARSVAISGNLAVVGAEFEDVQTPSGVRFNAGAAHVYDLRTGQHIARLVPGDPQGNGSVGHVAIDGNRVLVGGRVGAAYVFDAISGQQLARLTPSTPTESFGMSLALDGTTALIGAASDASRGAFTGAAYVFDISTYQEVRKIIPADAAAMDAFGGAVDLDGSNAIIGSSLHFGTGRFSGAAYVFDVVSGQQLAKLLPPVGGSNLAFGVDVAIDGERALVGSPNDRRRGQFAGAAHLFHWPTQQAVVELVPSDIKAGDWFGISVDFNENYLVGGATKQQQGATHGSAYFFAIPEPSSAVGAFMAFCFVGAAFRRKTIDAKGTRLTPIGLPTWRAACYVRTRQLERIHRQSSAIAARRVSWRTVLIKEVRHGALFKGDASRRVGGVRSRGRNAGGGPAV